MFFRNDGLLRGSREERIEAMFSLATANWGLETLLELHCGLLDHAEEVRAAAMDTLQAIAKRKPDPISLTPADMLSRFVFSFTVSSGVRLATFCALVELETPETDDAVEQILLCTVTNEDFSDFVQVLQRVGKAEILRRLPPSRLSKTKAAILRSAFSGDQ